MPSGRTHDAITFVLMLPAAWAAYAATANLVTGSLVGLAFAFGGFMFGPDLDTVSRQYSRWGPFRVIWFPYRSFFKHRSRFSHGLIFGALLRVIYLLGVLTLLGFAVTYVFTWITGGSMPSIMAIADTWRGVGARAQAQLGQHSLLYIFLGLWLGAASHTFTDVAGSFVSTGRMAKYL